MKKTAIVGVVAAAIGLVVGSQFPRSGTAGYVVITGTTKNREAAKEYFQNVNQVTNNTQAKERGKKTFQPNLINWS